MAEFGLRDAIDIGVVALFVGFAIRTLRSTRARPALLGLLLLFFVYGAARFLELELTADLLQAFSAVLVLVLVVIFQEDLRRVFEQLGTFVGRRPRDATPASGATQVLVRCVARMAANRTGALLIIPGREALDRHLEGGVALEGRVSEPLLLSLFDASSPGHDGAVVVRDGRVERFAAHLPLSADHDQIGPGGTRHAAALGLAERCDATCIVVSEERGTVSIARAGRIETLARPEELAERLRAIERTPAPEEAVRQPVVWLEALAALAIAFGLWTVWVPGQTLAELTATAQIEIRNLPDGFELLEVEPSVVRVTFAGRRRDLLLTPTDSVSVSIDGYLARLGRRTFELGPANVSGPPNLEVLAVEPGLVKISLAEVSVPAPAPTRTSGPTGR